MSEVEVSYRKDKDYKMLPITGVWGSIIPTGLIQCNFFIEKQDIPETVKIDIDEKTGEVKESKVRLFFTREVLVGIVLQPHTARSIGEWLIKYADKCKEQLNEGKE